MSVQRSPPMVSAGSHPDLSKLRDESTNISFRKRKHIECNCDHSEVLLEFQNKIMQTITSTLETQNQNIITTLESLRQDVNGFRHDLETVNSKILMLSDEQTCIKKDVSDLQSINSINNSKMQTVSHELLALQTTVANLSDQLRVKEQQGRINNLEITGIPVTKGENLINIVHNIAKKINFPITTTDIDYIHRVRRFKAINSSVNTGESASNVTPIPNIIVKFTQRKRKSDMLAAVRARRGLTTADAGLDGPAKPIFINDHLTPQNKQLYKQARLLAKESDYKYVWLSDCKILLKKNDTSKTLCVSSDTDLAKIK
ncbi:hypothetical protein PYW08_005205 [Mythimna loreyi]|uniref:Uncharacterized protein n=1 Tax=Mythimna loreyi TaxID=667449 RepID=A0ACC2QGB1_9NEOP|nr:hypothetical protein PYW08_005205 [Mythimna loreyi]